MTNARLLMSFFLEPRSAVRSLQERPTFLFPLLLITLGAAASLVWYFSVVDYAWLVDHTMQQHDPDHGNLTEAQKAEMASMMTRDVLMWSSLVAVLFGIPLVRLLESAYYFLAGRAIGVSQSFKHWLALACWSSLPAVLTLGASGVVLVMHPNGQVTQEQLSVLSLNELLDVPLDNPWYSLLSSVTVLHPWMLWLSAVGVQAWSGRSMAFSFGFALLPWLVVYGLWALLVLVW
jgi:hypothetical protein